MKCPYCENEMQTGNLKGETKSRLTWVADDEQKGVLNFLDHVIYGKGMIETKKNLTGYKIPANYCKNCRKIIFDVDIRM